MNSRTIQVMAVVALVVAGAAWYSTRSNKPASAKPSQVGAELFPGLAKKTGEVKTIKVESKEGVFTLEKQADVWGMTEKGGYSVNFDKVKDLVSKVAYFKIVAPMTSKPELYHKLEVDDVDKPDAKSTRVTLTDNAGAVLADVLVGKSAEGGGPLSSIYVRKQGDPQTYEVSGNLYIEGTASNWLDKSVVKLDRARVHKVETLQGDGTKLVISKASPDEKNFAVVDLPAGAELKWPGVADAVAGNLENLNFEDVEQAGKVDFSDPTTTTTTMQTFDGMLVTVKVLEKEGKFYSQFSARADPSARVEVTKFETPPAPPTPPVDPTLPVDPSAPPPTPPAPPQPIETKSVPGKTAEEVAKEASELDARLTKWTYVLPGYIASNFSKKMSDMLKEPEPPVAPPVDPALPTVPPTDHPVDDGHGHAQEPAKSDGR